MSRTAQHASGLMPRADAITFVAATSAGVKLGDIATAGERTFRVVSVVGCEAHLVEIVKPNPSRKQRNRKPCPPAATPP